MGTTLTALLFNGGRVHLAHVGDSRAFLFRDGRIEQLSEDHSWINEQVKAGLITDEEAKHSKFKHIITRSVGFERDVSVDVMSLPVLMGDCFLICSDGLSNYLETDEIGRLLTTGYYSRVPGLLVDLANERGGDDNITVVLVYVANDSGLPLVEDLSKPDPGRATTHPGPDPTLSQSNASPLAAEPGTPSAAALPEAAPSAAALPEAAPAAQPAVTDTPTPPEAAPAQPSLPAESTPGTPGQVIDPLADTAPANLVGGQNVALARIPRADPAAPEISTEEPTPEAGVPAAPKPEEPS
jgi:protein phosphatase